jgi:membrane protein YdbS with pleckstrin-like domain
MQCPRCSAEVDPQAKFCPSCGAALAEGEAPAGRAAGLAPRQGESVEDERELWEGGYSPKAMVGVWVLLAIVSVAIVILAIMLSAGTLGVGAPVVVPVAVGIVVVMWLVGLAVMLVRKWSMRYTVTTQRLIHRRGILSRTTDRIELIDVDDITFRQGLVERMVGVGTIEVSSSDVTHPKLALLGIDDVQRIADVIDDARRTERRRRGLHIESI